MAKRNAKAASKKTTTRGRSSSKSTTPRTPSKGRDLSKKEKIELAKIACEFYASGKYTLESCLKKAGIKSGSTWHAWKTQIEEIEDLYETAIAQRNYDLDVRLEEKATRQLERKIDGYKSTSTRVKKIRAKNGRLVIKEEVTTTKEIEPSLAAIEFILVNRSKKRWQKTPSPEKGDGGALPFTGFRFIIPKDSSE